MLTETSSTGLYNNIAPGYSGLFFPVTIKLTTSGPGGYTFSGGSYDQSFTGGNFTVFDGSTELVGGTFGASDLKGTNGSPSGSLQLAGDTVTYNAASTLLDGFSPSGGALTLEFTSPGAISATTTGVSSFSATDGITYSASPAPEPSEIATLGLCAFGLLGLMVRARKAAPVSDTAHFSNTAH